MDKHQASVADQPAAVTAGKFFTITNPATGESVAEVPEASVDDVNAAVQAARNAIETSDWAYDGQLRATVMLQWADRIAEDIDPLARELTRENGKVLGESRFEIGSQVGRIRYNAGLARTLGGKAYSLGREVFGVVAAEPMGVVAVISPWNWPVTLMVRDMAPALAAGNAVIVKPASQTAKVCADVVHHLTQCPDLPPGIVTVLTGPGSSVGQAIVEHPGIDMIAFTGDASTGRGLMRDAAPTLKKLSLELGGKSPMVICDDANLDKAIPELVSGIFTTTAGQICTAPSRVVVQRSIYEEVVKRLQAAVRAIRVGNGLDSGVQMGPLATRSQFDKVVSYIDLGRREATLIAGGDVLTDGEYRAGNFVAPTVFSDVAVDSRLVQDEIFGPVLVVQVFDTDQEAIELANATPYGLASAVWTENVHRAWRIARGIQAGTVWVNTYNRFYDEAEVGGYKQSGYGRMQGIEGLHEFTQTKHINFDDRGMEAGVGKADSIGA
jgi:betaine-aldehyde dehydrogenase